LILAGANSYTGDTVVRQGTLTVAPTGSLGDPSFGLEVSNNNTTGPGTNTVVNLSTVNDTTVSTLSGFITAPTSGTNTATINTGGAGLNFTVNQTAAFTAPAGIAGAGNFILGSGSTSTLTLTGNLSYSGTTTVNAGTLNLQTSLPNTSSVTVAGGNVILASNGSFNRVIRTGSISIAAGSKVNIDNNKMILTSQSVGSWNGSAYTGVTGLVASGYGPNQDFGGTTGIVTTQTTATGGNTLHNIGVASNTDLGLATFGGVSVAPNATLVMFTYGGDANLDGMITGDDYFQIDSAFPNPNAHGWFNGDFNYDGVITGDDYFIIDSNFPAQGAPIPTSAGVGDASGLAGIQAVPEPASIGVIGIAASLLGRRRRRCV
jgi:autotransporter-associated beta strand protein